jgi:hypothetical protein
MIYVGLINGNETNNYPRCDVVVQAPASLSSWMQVANAQFVILVSVCAQLPKIHVYFNPLLNYGNKSP